MHERSRKREVRLSTKNILESVKCDMKVELHFIGTLRCGCGVISKWILEHFNGFSFYQPKPINSSNLVKKDISKILTSTIKQKSNLTSRRQGKGVCVGVRINLDSMKESLKIPFVYKDHWTIMVLRDPINQFSSIEKSYRVWNKSSLSAREYINLRNLWIDHAQNFIKKPMLENNTLRIVFDKWVKDSIYRKQILDALGNNFDHSNVDLNKAYSQSPFKTLNILSRGQEMSDSHPTKALLQDTIIQKLYQKVIAK